MDGDGGPSVRDGTLVLTPRRVFLHVAASCAFGIAAILLLADDWVVAIAAASAFGVATAISLLIATAWGDGTRPSETWRRCFALGLLGATAALPGWYFGPSSAYAGVVAIILVFTGLLMGGVGTRFPADGGWFVYAGLAGGQGVVAALVLSGTIRDAGLLPVVPANATAWHHVVAHVMVQLVYAAAFAIGRALHRRYWTVVEQLEQASHALARRDALLDEARAEYRRVVALGEAASRPRRPDDTSGSTAPTKTLEPASEPAQAPQPGEAIEVVTHEIARVSGVSLEDVSTTAWRGARADTLRLQYTAVVGACIAGALFLAAVIRDRTMLLVGLGSIALAAGFAAITRNGARSWSWPLVAAVAIGPAYVLGLHCAIIAVAVVVLFLEGRSLVLAAVLVTHGGAYAALVAGVLPDRGLTPVLHHIPAWRGVVIEALVLAIFVVAFVLGRTIHRAYVELVERAERIAREAARQEAALVTARAEIGHVLATYERGLFAGTRVDDYEIGRLLGRGGMGEVYEATRGGRTVALKVLRADQLSRTSVERLAREAETLVRIDSPNVARVLDVGTANRELPYLVMELVVGPSLADVLRKHERLTLVEVRTLAREASRGLADVHRAGIIHRDIKPHNLMYSTVADASGWKLVDFGIAKAWSAPDDPRKLVGTPAYMAPEQLAGRPLDARVDLYSLSLVIYRALTGQPAFGKLTTVRAPIDPLAFVQVHSDLGLALRIGLASSPADRFASAEQLGEAIVDALDGKLSAALRTRGRSLCLQEPWRSP